MPKFKSKKEYDAWKKQLITDLQSTSLEPEKQRTENATSTSQKAINRFERIESNSNSEKNKQLAIFISHPASDISYYMKKLGKRRWFGASLLFFVIIMLIMILKVASWYSLESAKKQSLDARLKQQEIEENKYSISGMEVDQIKREVSETFATIFKLWLEDNFNEIYSNYGSAGSRKSSPTFVAVMENKEERLTCCWDTVQNIQFHTDYLYRKVIVRAKLGFNKKGVPFSDFTVVAHLDFMHEDKWRINLVDIISAPWGKIE